MLKFNPKPSDAALSALETPYNALDLMIVTLPSGMIPLREPEGATLWQWGVIEVCGVKIPAPYRNVGYNWRGERFALKPYYSAVSNLRVLLEMLQNGDDFERSLNQAGYPPFITSAVILGSEWFQQQPSRKILSALHEECMNDVSAYRIID
jgi:hypothetical protein